LDNGKVKNLVTDLLKYIGEDPSREGLIETPRRVSDAYEFLTSGYNKNIEEVMNDALFNEKYDEMVLVKDIDFYSLCEHHMLPFYGKVHVA
jgi:GTP cyclohydrolase IA